MPKTQEQKDALQAHLDAAALRARAWDRSPASHLSALGREKSNEWPSDYSPGFDAVTDTGETVRIVEKVQTEGKVLPTMLLVDDAGLAYEPLGNGKVRRFTLAHWGDIADAAV